MKSDWTLRVAFAISVVFAGACAGDEEERVMEWRQYPVPHGTLETKRPPDEAFLELAPHLKELGTVSDEAKGLGAAVWWADCGQHLFSEQPPTDEDLARKGVIRTPAGEDEPAVNEQSLSSFRGLEPVRKHFRIVTAISDHAASAYADLLDVWVVNAGRTTPDLQELAAGKKGAELWNYTCHNRGRGEAPFNRSYAGIYTWALRLKGNFIWAYTENYSREGGQYLPWSPIYCYVVPSDAGLVPSVAWEARAWLEEIRGKVDWFLARKMPPSLYPWDGPEIYPLCPNFEPKELAQVRAKAIDYVLALVEGEGG